MWSCLTIFANFTDRIVLPLLADLNKVECVKLRSSETLLYLSKIQLHTNGWFWPIAKTLEVWGVVWWSKDVLPMQTN